MIIKTPDGKKYDGSEVPIMLILSEADKRNIAAMHPECMKYCEYPEKQTAVDIDEFMEIPKPGEPYMLVID